MPAIYLSEQDVEAVLTMQESIEAIETVFRKLAASETANIPRQRVRTDKVMLHLMGAAAKTLDATAVKMYTSTRDALRFWVTLFDGKTGEMQAIIAANELGAVRTGAASGVATKYLARADSSTVGVFGCGIQARTQLEAVCAVSNIEEAYIYSRKAEHREQFAHEMTARLGIKAVAVAKPELAAEDKDIIITATTSTEPVLQADWVAEGTHINAVGANFLGRAELDAETVRRCNPIIVDDKEQARLEAGDVVRAIDAGVLRWSDVGELGNLVVGRQTGRRTPTDITLFKSVGIALEDLAVAKVVYRHALERGMGQILPF